MFQKIDYQSKNVLTSPGCRRIIRSRNRPPVDYVDPCIVIPLKGTGDTRGLSDFKIDNEEI